MLTSCCSLFFPPKEVGGHLKARYRKRAVTLMALLPFINVIKMFYK